jgi:uncharacterized glyoxalase superfamily protein PhnB
MTGNLAFQSLTPILYVDAIEPCLPFWVDRLGFTITISVPEGETLSFAAVACDGIEVMYQTHASMAKDIGAVGSMRSPTMLFCRVANLDAIITRLGGADIAVPRRRTPYGADEIYVRTVGGHIVGFAAFPKTSDK